MNFFTKILSKFPIFLVTLVSPSLVLAASSDGPATLDMITSPIGIACLLLFIIAYGFVMAEEFTHFRKSKPVILVTAIWAMIAFYASSDPSLSAHWAEGKFKHLILEFAELFFFLFVAMTYVNALTERKMFDALCSGSQIIILVIKDFVITGVIAFFLSPIADNLTTALILERL